MDIKNQSNKLTVSIDKPMLSSQKLLLRTSKINSTTIRIRVIPNGYVGINTISCYWNNNRTFAQTADLIIGST